MTLNILLATPSTLYVASDFRLTDADRAVLSDHSPKLIVVIEEGWSACITYCGIGSWKKETYQWLKHWLKHEPSEIQQFQDVARSIAVHAERWVQDIRNSSRKIFPHSFLMAGFVDKEATVALISNFDSLIPGKKVSLSDKFMVESRRIDTPMVIVTGQKKAVGRADRRLLLAAAASDADADGVGRSIARVVARTSASSEARGTVSSSCFTYSMLREGRGVGKLHGKVTGRLVPLLLARGVDLQDLVQVRPAPGRQVQVLGMTTHIVSVGAERVEEECHPEIVCPEGDDLAANLVLAELPSLEGPRSNAHAINRFGHVVGSTSLKASGPPVACLWSEQGHPRDLGTLGGPSSSAKDINDRGQIVGFSSNATGENHAFLWTEGEGMKDLGTLGGVASHAHAINSSGSIVGASWTIPGRSPGDKKERAFLWTSSEGMLELGTLPGGWSRALDINDLDQIVGISPVGAFTRAFIWTRANGMTDLGTLGGPSARALAINNLGQVVGMSETEQGHNRPFMWTPETKMIELPLEKGSYLVGLNDAGVVILSKETDMGTRAFIWSSVLGAAPLPWFRWHQTSPADINRDGTIAGQAWKGQHSHALLWDASAWQRSSVCDRWLPHAEIPEARVDSVS